MTAKHAGGSSHQGQATSSCAATPTTAPTTVAAR
jgi:hypothetical protein